jgi:hypothetical protein
VRRLDAALDFFSVKRPHSLLLPGAVLKKKATIPARRGRTPDSLHLERRLRLLAHARVGIAFGRFAHSFFELRIAGGCQKRNRRAAHVRISIVAEPQEPTACIDAVQGRERLDDLPADTRITIDRALGEFKLSFVNAQHAEISSLRRGRRRAAESHALYDFQ